MAMTQTWTFHGFLVQFPFKLNGAEELKLPKEHSKFSISVNLMKPMDDGKYPGVSQDFDHTEVESDNSQSTQPETPPPNNYELSGVPTGTADNVDMPASDTADMHPDAPDGEDGLELDDDSDSLELETEDTPTITLENLIPEPGESDEDGASQNWLDFEGKKIHKASVIRCLFLSEMAKKSWEHLLCVTFIEQDKQHMMPALTHNEDGNPTLPAMQQLLLWMGSYCKLAPLKQKKKSNSKTWAVFVIELSAVVDALWELTELNQANSHVPKCSGDSSLAFVAEMATRQLLTKQLGNTDKTIECPVCKKTIKHKALRSHMGGHILQAQMGILEDDINVPVSMVDLCGFCGQLGHPVQLVKEGQKRTFQPSLSCPFSIIFSIGAAVNSTKTSPSMNVPI
ncbi:hypothetical protein BS17DRAFT_766894 [Gyrodon lividus]|nr:hypothetical protein BS17DRAFT_766894 [Gyrodon lividus]